jgi:hypothetical protein
MFAAAATGQTVPGQNDRPDAHALSVSLAALKGMVNDRNFGKMGFLTLAEASSAVFGDPTRRYIVRHDKLVGFKAGSDPAALLEDARQWIYPVLYRGVVRCAVTMASRPPGGWKAIAYGDQGLARALFEMRHNESTQVTPSREDLFFLVDILSVNQKFVARRTDGLAPVQPPGQRNLLFTWVGRPAAENSRTQPAEEALMYLSIEARRDVGRGPR